MPLARADAEELFESKLEWSRGVAMTAVRRVGQRADPDELRQVAACKTWDCAVAFEPRRWTSRPAGDPFEIYAYPSVIGACLMAGYRGLAGRRRGEDGAYIAFESLESAGQSARVQPAVEAAMDGTIRTRLVALLLSDLPKRERHLIAEHYLGGASLSAVAVSLHTSQASVSRLHASALRLLRAAVARRGMTAGVWLF